MTSRPKKLFFVIVDNNSLHKAEVSTIVINRNIAMLVQLPHRVKRAYLMLADLILINASMLVTTMVLSESVAIFQSN